MKLEDTRLDRFDKNALSARFGNKESLEELEIDLYKVALKVTSAMIRSYKINIDSSEAGDYLLVFHETILDTVRLFNPFFGDYYSYFLSSYVTNLFAYFEDEYRDNVILFNSLSLDSFIADTEIRLYDVVPSGVENDPRYAYIENEANTIFFADDIILRKEQTRKFKKNNSKSRLQRQLILLKYRGWSLKELAKIYGVNERVIRRLLENDADFMPLGKLKKIFNKN